MQKAARLCARFNNYSSVNSSSSSPEGSGPDAAVGPKRRLPVRVIASLIHLSISLLVASVLVAIIFLVWYPTPYSTITGVAPIFAMLVGVDVALGPFITLLIFNPKKKWLRF